MIKELRHRIVLGLSAGTLVVATTLAAPQRPPLPPAPASKGIQTAPLTSVMPVDPFVRLGTLPNGVRYYVRGNARPAARAELRLVVKTGSVLEDDDQRGLAHFVEHMAFDGTSHFPKQQIIGFMQSLGMKFGAHVNAYTSFDETVFQLQVPADNINVLDESLLILEDWAHNVSFDPVEIEKERGVVTEEWRLGLGADERIRDKEFPVLLKGSKYATRIPIGSMDVIQHFQPDALKRFYADWYRPDLIGVVAVGDFDTAAVEALIRKHFGPLTGPVSPRPRPTYDVPEQPGTRYAVTTDKEATQTTIEIENLLPARVQGTIGEYREEMIDRLFEGMLSARLDELAHKPDAPFLQTSVGRGLFLARTREQTALAALVKDDGIERGLSALVTEAARAAQFGFTQTELDRLRTSLLRAYEQIVVAQDNRESSDRAEEYIRNFVQGEPLPTVADEYELHKRFLPQVTLADINSRAREWFQDRNRVVLVNAPERPGMAIPDEARLAKVLQAETGSGLKAYTDTAGDAKLLTAVPTPGSIARTTVKDAVGITEWELSNGVKVVLKPTTNSADEIVMRATSPGGTSLASAENYIAASSAAQVVGAGGLGSLSATDLQKVMTGKLTAVRPFIGDTETGVVGGSTVKDLETMFQLVYMTFTQPRADATAFAVQLAQARSILANQAVDPEYAFAETLTNVLGQNHPRRRLPTVADLDQWNLERSTAFYKARFADAGNFTFVFVGSFDVNAMRPLVERYLGSLPSLRQHDTWKDVGAPTATGVIEKRVDKGLAPKSHAAIVFSGPFVYDQAHRVLLRAVAQALGARVINSLRQQLGGAYSPSVAPRFDRAPRPEYSITVEFGCDPQRTDELVRRVFQEIDALKMQGPSDGLMSDIREGFQREFETNIRENRYLLSEISGAYESGEDAAKIWDLPALYRALDAATIRQAARTYLNLDNYVKVTLFPEK
jgi:zinc protease